MAERRRTLAAYAAGLGTAHDAVVTAIQEAALEVAGAHISRFSIEQAIAEVAPSPTERAEPEAVWFGGAEPERPGQTAGQIPMAGAPLRRRVYPHWVRG